MPREIEICQPDHGEMLGNFLPPRNGVLPLQCLLLTPEVSTNKKSINELKYHLVLQQNQSS